MLRRALVILALSLVPLLIPLAVLAEDTPASAAPPAAAPAAGLGPETSKGAGGSNADAAALQPAGRAPLQSTTSDSAGLTAPTGAPLQAPATTDEQLRVLAGEAEGAPQSAGDSEASAWTWVDWSFGLAAAAIIAWLSYRTVRRRRLARRP